MQRKFISIHRVERDFFAGSLDYRNVALAYSLVNILKDWEIINIGVN